MSKHLLDPDHNLISAKLDNHPQLQRQIGCMNGIFHLFDRHHSFTARTPRRRTTHRSLPPTPNPQCKSTTGEDKEESGKQRNHRSNSMESPRTSFSSSISSSTFSSMDNNKTYSGKQTVDLRDVVKDSIYKETVPGLSVKTTRGANHTIKNVDSPRPSLPYKPNETETFRSKYAPRFSYDGRESRDSWTSTMKLKELPRLSLDSRQSTKHVQNEGIHRRSSSVVAKLMGLEGLPDSVSVSSDIRQDENLDTTPRLLRSKYNQDSIPASNSISGSSPHLTPRKPASPTSIYGEIEKRLTDLEFKSSGKDLRALKQILEAMEKTRERLEVKKEEYPSNLEHQNMKDCTNFGNPDQNSRSEHNSYPASPTSKRNGSSSTSSIVIMKSAKFPERRTSASSAAMPINKLINSDAAAAGGRNRKSSNISVDKIQGPRENHLRHQQQQQQQPRQNGIKTKTKAMHSLKLPPQPLPVSPRLLQQKKHHNNQPNDQSSSPGRKIKLKSSIPKRSDKKGTTKTSQQGDTASVQSDSIDSEVQSTGHSEEINSLYQQDITQKLRKDAATGEFNSTLEQPSPVSVLDATFYREGSPSPVRKISNSYTDDETQNSEETEWSTTVELDHLINNTDTDSQSVFNQEKLESINQLVLKLRQLNSTNNETDEASYIPHNSDDKNPDHIYITQIILASGLLFKDLSAYNSTAMMQLKPPLLNPSLFLVLEQTKGSIDQSNISEKIHRKLIFDVVNEILVQKINDSEFYRSCISVEKLGQKKLVKELCFEVDLLLGKADCGLQDEDDEEDYLISMLNEEIMRKSGNWIDYRSEFPALALDIERLIFKDLITEVVQGRGNYSRSFHTSSKPLFI